MHPTLGRSRFVSPYSEPVREYMLKTRHTMEADVPVGDACPSTGSAGARPRPRVALLSNPKSTGNLAQLPRIRAYCVDHPDVFHYEVERADQIGEAMKTIARVRPKLLVINGGDGTVQAALTELHNGAHFGDEAPPVAVLPSGKTNLIALDLGVRGDPIEALERLIAIAQGDLEPYTVARELIALRRGEDDGRPTIGMFMGGAALAETMLYCREKIYPLGLPNSVAHVLAVLAGLAKLILPAKASFLPPDTNPLSVSLSEPASQLTGRFSLLMVTTLEKLLLSMDVRGERQGTLKLLAVEARPTTLVAAFVASVAGKLGRSTVSGVHFKEADEITIESESSSVILDGETFHAETGSPIYLRPAQPLSFVKLAA